MIKAVFIDIDGTLLRSDHTVSEVTIQTIKQLQEKNVLVVLVSARPLHGILPISKIVGLETAPTISLNGSYIAQNNKVIFKSSIPTSVTLALHDAVQPYHVTTLYYQENNWFAENSSQYTIAEQKITDVPVTIQPLSHTIEQWNRENTGPNKIMMIADATTIQTIQEKLKALFAETLNMFTSKPIYLEAMQKDASKAKAVLQLIQEYHITTDEIITIGDNFNDLEMIEMAGTGIAMGNAPDAVKAVAKYVTDTNNNDGVAKAIQHFLKQWF
ncbi:MAG: Cof-type HAD-IIB family hydrolase [Sphingobacteriales bacterium]|uniref:Cof-type HAD-IIB family hydrolase n=1 Tax=Hydrotalea flava TaxID=714549 RepID=UPI000833D1FD|nr:Cof-type HAD-IIB family hydrolase [Hydrotalea flava]RTL56638.1 MAG: Cof-type HAD-IIB family hydrolase [Sphingobacteriales bacterium]